MKLSSQVLKLRYFHPSFPSGNFDALYYQIEEIKARGSTIFIV